MCTPSVIADGMVRIFINMEKIMTHNTKLTPEQKWEQATLSNNFIFYKVMRYHPEACKTLLEMLLDITIESMEMNNEEEIMVDPDSKSIRLDVFVKEKKRIFDIELQVANTKELPERARYYQGVMDIDTLKAGEHYKNLRDNHVIFLCMEDIFDKELPVYTFSNICNEDCVTELGDRAFKHFFIVPSCAKMLKSAELRAFFKFVIDNCAETEYTIDLHSYVESAKKNLQWRWQYMNWERQRTYDFDAGMEKGARDAKLEAARNLLTNGVDPEIIAKSTGLSLEEVLNLQTQNI